MAEPVTLSGLEERLGYSFADPALLRQAVSHRSWAAEHPGEDDNERLEFLGDAIVGVVVADMAYRRHPDLLEGPLTALRISVVNASALAAAARDLGLGAHIMLGRGEMRTNGREKDSILSDAFEAVVGAVWLDGGPPAAFALVERLLGPRLDDSSVRLDRIDHKSALQELTARLLDSAPVYVLTDVGPAHDKWYTATVLVDGEALGVGEGRSKKVAEQAAADQALERLEARAADAASTDAPSTDAASTSAASTDAAHTTSDRPDA